MTAVFTRIGATGSLRPLAKSGPVLLMASEPPKRFDASGLPAALGSAENAGIGDFVRQFISVTEAGGFFVSGYSGTMDAKVGGSETGVLTMDWKPGGTIKFAQIHASCS